MRAGRSSSRGAGKLALVVGVLGGLLCGATAWAGLTIGRDVPGAVHRMAFGPGIELDSAPGGAYLTSFGGPIRLQSVHGRIKLKSYGQEIRVERLDGRGSAIGYGGDVFVRVVGEPAGALSLRSYGGDVTVIVPPELALKVQVVQIFDVQHEGRVQLASDIPLTTTESPNWKRSFWSGKEKKWRRSSATTGDGRYALTIFSENGDVKVTTEAPAD